MAERHAPEVHPGLAITYAGNVLHSLGTTTDWQDAAPAERTKAYEERMVRTHLRMAITDSERLLEELKNLHEKADAAAVAAGAPPDPLG